MPVELRKRKPRDPPPAPAPPAKKKAATKAKESVKKSVEKVEKAISSKEKKPAAASSKAAATGETISLDGFGGEVETNDGKKTTLKALLEEAEKGVVLFTYPKASTPGCKCSLSFHLAEMCRYRRRKMSCKSGRVNKVKANEWGANIDFVI
jgi:peroxiredoxin Q/BCP